MEQETMRWVGTIIISSVSVQFVILGLLFVEKFQLPGTLIVSLNIGYTGFATVLLWWILNVIKLSTNLISQTVFAHLLLGAAFTLVILIVIGLRYKKGENFGKKYILRLLGVDLQVNFILSTFDSTEIDELKRRIDNGLNFIVDTIAQIFDLREDHDESHISVLLANAGRFHVIAQKGIPPNHIHFIEERFRYGQTVVGVAGRVATTKRQVYIKDLSNEDNPDIRDWIAVEPSEKKQGSLYCYPIIRGVGSEEEEILAVISLTSKCRNAFDSKSLPDMIPPIAAKIETFIYLLEMHNSYEENYVQEVN